MGNGIPLQDPHEPGGGADAQPGGQVPRGLPGSSQAQPTNVHPDSTIDVSNNTVPADSVEGPATDNVFTVADSVASDESSVKPAMDGLTFRVTV